MVSKFCVASINTKMAGGLTDGVCLALLNSKAVTKYTQIRRIICLPKPRLPMTEPARYHRELAETGA